jgi:hypothetical protein
MPNPDAPFNAFVLGSVTDEEGFYEAANAAPHYGTHVSPAISRVIRAIHGIEKLHQRCRLQDLEVYLGRSGWSSAVSRLWSHASGPKQMQFGGPLFTCDAARAARLEGLAIKVLMRLKAADRLCVGNANISPHGGGGRSSDDISVVYLAWRQRPSDNPDRKPTMSLVREIAKDLAPDFDDLVSKPRMVIEKGLMVARAPSNRLRVSLWLS